MPQVSQFVKVQMTATFELIQFFNETTSNTSVGTQLHVNCEYQQGQLAQSDSTAKRAMLLVTADESSSITELIESVYVQLIGICMQLFAV